MIHGLPRYDTSRGCRMMEVYCIKYFFSVGCCWLPVPCSFIKKITKRSYTQLYTQNSIIFTHKVMQTHNWCSSIGFRWRSTPWIRNQSPLWAVLISSIFARKNLPQTLHLSRRWLYEWVCLSTNSQLNRHKNTFLLLVLESKHYLHTQVYLSILMTSMRHANKPNIFAQQNAFWHGDAWLRSVAVLLHIASRRFWSMWKIPWQQKNTLVEVERQTFDPWP